MKPFENVKIGAKYTSRNGKTITITSKGESTVVGKTEEDKKIEYDLDGSSLEDPNLDLVKIDDSFYPERKK